MIIAPVGSSLKVSGSSMAMVAGGPSPGNTPMTVPRTTPITHIVMLFHVSATWNPCINPETISIAVLQENAARQVQVQAHIEDEVEAGRERHGPDERLRLRLP